MQFLSKFILLFFCSHISASSDVPHVVATFSRGPFNTTSNQSVILNIPSSNVDPNAFLTNTPQVSTAQIISNHVNATQAGLLSEQQRQSDIARLGSEAYQQKLSEHLTQHLMQQSRTPQPNSREAILQLTIPKSVSTGETSVFSWPPQNGVAILPSGQIIKTTDLARHYQPNSNTSSLNNVSTTQKSPEAHSTSNAQLKNTNPNTVAPIANSSSAIDIEQPKTQPVLPSNSIHKALLGQPSRIPPMTPSPILPPTQSTQITSQPSFLQSHAQRLGESIAVSLMKKYLFGTKEVIRYEYIPAPPKIVFTHAQIMNFNDDTTIISQRTALARGVLEFYKPRLFGQQALANDVITRAWSNIYQDRYNIGDIETIKNACKPSILRPAQANQPPATQTSISQKSIEQQDTAPQAPIAQAANDTVSQLPVQHAAPQTLSTNAPSKPLLEPINEQIIDKGDNKASSAQPTKKISSVINLLIKKGSENNTSNNTPESEAASTVEKVENKVTVTPLSFTQTLSNPTVQKLFNTLSISIPQLSEISRTESTSSIHSSICDSITNAATEWNNLVESGINPHFINAEVKTALETFIPLAIELNQVNELESAQLVLHELDAFTQGLHGAVSALVEQTQINVVNSVVNVPKSTAMTFLLRTLSPQLSLAYHLGKTLYGLYSNSNQLLFDIKRFYSAYKKGKPFEIGRELVKTGVNVFYLACGIRQTFDLGAQKGNLDLVKKTINQGIKNAKIRASLKKDTKSIALKTKREITPTNLRLIFKSTEFGKWLEPFCEKDKGKYWRISKDTGNPYLQEGYYFYLDDMHYDHIEVFNRKGDFKAVLNLNGSYNEAKSKAAKNRSIDV